MSSPSGPPGQPQDHGWQQGPQPQYANFQPQPQQPRSKKPWLIIAGALGCVALLVLGVGVGIGFLALRGGGEDPTSAPSTATESASPTQDATLDEGGSEDQPFVVISPIQDKVGTADEILEVLKDNPMTSGSLGSIGSCELPAITAEATEEELQTFLDAGNACLGGSLADTMSQRNLQWSTPTVVVYTWPDIPSDADCTADTFEQTTPRMCNLDNVLYWPLVTEGAVTSAAPEDLAGAYMLDLGFSLMNPVNWQTSLGVYHGQRMDQLDESDPEWTDGYRRYILQARCISTALAMELPDGAEPTPGALAILTDEKNWTAGTPPRDIPPSALVRWSIKGRDSGGDLSACNTWVAESFEIDG